MKIIDVKAKPTHTTDMHREAEKLGLKSFIFDPFYISPWVDGDMYGVCMLYRNGQGSTDHHAMTEQDLRVLYAQLPELIDWLADEVTPETP